MKNAKDGEKWEGPLIDGGRTALVSKVSRRVDGQLRTLAEFDPPVSIEEADKLVER